MKKFLGLICLSFLFTQCKNSIKNENAEVSQETGTITQDTDTIINTVSEPKPIDTTIENNVFGFWVGYFEKDIAEEDENKKDLYVDEGFIWARENKINISIDKIDGEKVSGHSVVAGNSRPFTGTIKQENGTFSFDVKEPGDNKYDGEFIFQISNSKLTGKWNAFKQIDIPKRKYQLKKMDFKYDPDRMLESSKRFVDWEKTDNKEMDEFSATFASATDEIYKINASNKLLNKEEVENLKKGDLLIIRNTIYARHGYSFKNRPLRIFFDAQTWYIPVYADIKKDFSEIEKRTLNSCFDMKKMQRNITIILAGASLLICCQSKSSEEIPATQKISEIVSSDSIVNDSIKVWKEINFTENQINENLAYADTANFMHEKIYPCAKCFLRPEVATALLKANQLAKAKNLRLIIFDCYRPKIYQQKMFDLVKDPRYVANPTKGSMHNKGLAIDLGLTDDKGKQLDFGTAFDDFTEKAHVNYSGISDLAKNNRKVLQDIMIEAGFDSYEFEWWHFNYTKAQYPLDDFVWNCN